MKKSILFTIAILIFTACGRVSEESKPAPVINADTVLDDQIFVEATSSTDLEKCKKILNDERGKECKLAVNSLLITQDALKKLDKSICEDIEIERYEENCLDEVQTTIDENKESEEKIKNMKVKDAAINSLQIEAVQKGDATICDKIDDENQKYSCRYNIIANQAIKAKDPSLCDQIGKQEVVQVCKNSVGTE